MRARQVGITDTTLRDGHQSLWATRMHTSEMIPVLELMDSIGFHSLECWGGATFDASLRFLDEDPWERLRLIKKHVARTPLQMLLRGQNIVGYRHYGDDIVRRFVYKAAENGMDVFRVFDALNDIRNYETAAAAIKETGKHFQGAVVYTISPVHSLDHYVDVAAQARRHGRRLHLHQGHGGAALAVLRRAARRPPQGRAQGAHPAALPLHRRPRPDDLPQGHRGRRGRHRHGHGAARVRQLAARHRDGRLRAHGHALRQRSRPREALRDGQVLREGPAGGWLGPRRHVAHAHAGVLAPGARRHDQQPREPAQGAERARPPARGARGDPHRARRGRLPAAGHADEPDRRHPGRAQRALRPALAHRAGRDEAVPARQVRRRSGPRVARGAHARARGRRAHRRAPGRPRRRDARGLPRGDRRAGALGGGPAQLRALPADRPRLPRAPPHRSGVGRLRRARPVPELAGRGRAARAERRPRQGHPRHDRGERGGRGRHRGGRPQDHRAQGRRGAGGRSRAGAGRPGGACRPGGRATRAPTAITWSSPSGWPRSTARPRRSHRRSWRSATRSRPGRRSASSR